MLAEDVLPAGAVAAFTKAQALYQEAKLLAEPAQVPHAAALALMGAEEFAQAVLCTVAALVPAHPHSVPCRRADHALTQHICTMAAVAQRVTSAFGSTPRTNATGTICEHSLSWGFWPPYVEDRH